MASRSPLRVAFIGVDHPHGAGWRESLALVPDELVLTAIVPEFPGTTTSLEERHARLPRYSTVEELLAHGNSQFDAAMVCLPNNAAPAVITQLARAGKHVLTEKPAGTNAAAFRATAQVVRESGVAFQAGYLWRFDEGANRLREMIADGRLGKLISIEMTCVTSDVQRRGPGHYLFDSDNSGGGFFNWLGCHYLDLVPYITGQSVVAVTARVGNFGATPTEVEDGGTAIFDLENRALATLTGGYWLPRWANEWQWTLRGSQRWVRWDPFRAGTGGVLEIHGPQPQFHAMEETFALPPDSTPGYGGRRCVQLLKDWAAAARSEIPDCRNNTTSALAVLDLLDAIYDSSAQGRKIERRIPAA